MSSAATGSAASATTSPSTRCCRALHDRELTHLFNRMKLFADSEDGSDRHNLHEKAKMSLGEHNQTLAVSHVDPADVTAYHRRRELGRKYGLRLLKRVYRRRLLDAGSGKRADAIKIEQLEKANADLEARLSKKKDTMCAIQ